MTPHHPFTSARAAHWPAVHLGHGLKLGPDNLRVEPTTQPTVSPCDDVLPPHQVGVAHQAVSVRLSRELLIRQSGQSAAALHRAAPTTVFPAGLPYGVAQTMRIGASRAPGLALPGGLQAPRLLGPVAPGVANRHAPAPRRPGGSPPHHAGENCPAIAAHSAPAPHS